MQLNLSIINLISQVNPEIQNEFAGDLDSAFENIFLSLQEDYVDIRDVENFILEEGEEFQEAPKTDEFIEDDIFHANNAISNIFLNHILYENKIIERGLTVTEPHDKSNFVNGDVALPQGLEQPLQYAKDLINSSRKTEDFEEYIDDIYSVNNNFSSEMESEDENFIEENTHIVETNDITLGGEKNIRQDQEEIKQVYESSYHATNTLTTNSLSNSENEFSLEKNDDSTIKIAATSAHNDHEAPLNEQYVEYDDNNAADIANKVDISMLESISKSNNDNKQFRKVYSSIEAIDNDMLEIYKDSENMLQDPSFEPPLYEIDSNIDTNKEYQEEYIAENVDINISSNEYKNDSLHINHSWSKDFSLELKDIAENKSYNSQVADIPNISEQIKVFIGKSLLNNEINKMTLQLEPIELGKLEITMAVENDIVQSIQINVEKLETLEVLQRDIQNLENSFRENGIKIATDNITMNLQQNNNFGQNKREFMEEQKIFLRDIAMIDNKASESMTNIITGNGDYIIDILA